jgi:hypothetical protein
MPLLGNVHAHPKPATNQACMDRHARLPRVQSQAADAKCNRPWHIHAQTGNGAACGSLIRHGVLEIAPTWNAATQKQHGEQALVLVLG